MSTLPLPQHTSQPHKPGCLWGSAWSLGARSIGPVTQVQGIWSIQGVRLAGCSPARAPPTGFQFCVPNVPQEWVTWTVTCTHSVPSRCMASSLVDRLVEQCHVVAVCDLTCPMFFPLSTGFHIWPQDRETCSESNRSLWLFVLRAGPGWAPTGSGAQGLQPALANLR